MQRHGDHEVEGRGPEPGATGPGQDPSEGCSQGRGPAVLEPVDHLPQRMRRVPVTGVTGPTPRQGEVRRPEQAAAAKVRALPVVQVGPPAPGTERRPDEPEPVAAGSAEAIPRPGRKETLASLATGREDHVQHRGQYPSSHAPRGADGSAACLVHGTGNRQAKREV